MKGTDLCHKENNENIHEMMEYQKKSIISLINRSEQYQNPKIGISAIYEHLCFFMFITIKPKHPGLNTNVRNQVSQIRTGIRYRTQVPDMTDIRTISTYRSSSQYQASFTLIRKLKASCPELEPASLRAEQTPIPSTFITISQSSPYHLITQKTGAKNEKAEEMTRGEDRKELLSWKTNK